MLSIFTAFCFGFSAVLVRMGMRYSNPMTGAIIGAAVQIIALTTILMGSSPTFRWDAVLFFAVSGILSSTLGRITNYLSIERMGVATSASIIGSSPLFTTFISAILLKEYLLPTTIIGALLIVIGVAVTSISNEKIRLKGMMILLPLISAFFYGASSPILKYGLNILREPVLGALIGSIASFLSYLLYLSVGGTLSQIKVEKRSTLFFIGSGLLVSAAWVAMYNALEMGSASVVAVIVGANPLFSLLLSRLLLSSEKITLRVVFGCLIIVSGVVIVTLF